MTNGGEHEGTNKTHDGSGLLGEAIEQRGVSEACSGKNEEIQIEDDVPVVQSNQQTQDDKRLLEVQGVLTTSSTLLGYTFLKWTYVILQYYQHGVVPEGNIYLMFLVFPFGVPVWIIGTVECFKAFVRINRKGFPVAKMRVDTRVILAVNFALVVLTLVELIVIFGKAA